MSGLGQCPACMMLTETPLSGWTEEQLVATLDRAK
jgi:hypothetical protein